MPRWTKPHLALPALARGCLSTTALRHKLDATLARVAVTGDTSLLLMLHFSPSFGHADSTYPMTQLALEHGTPLRQAECDCVALDAHVLAILIPNCLPSSGERWARKFRDALAQLQRQHDLAGPVCRIGGAYAMDWLHSSSALWLERTWLQLRQTSALHPICIDQITTRDSTVTAEEKTLIYDCSPSADNTWQ